SGKAPTQESDVGNWQLLLAQLAALQASGQIKTLSYGNYRGEIASFVKNGGALSSDAKGQVLDQLKGYSRDDLTALGLPIVCRPACAEGCDWRAQDCTIDLATVVRLS